MANSGSWTDPVKTWWGQAGQTIPNLNPVQHFYPQRGYAALGEQSIPLHPVTPTQDFSSTYNPHNASQKSPHVSQSAYPSAVKIRKYKRLRKACKIIVTINNVISSILTILMEGAMLFMIYVYYKTRHVASGSRQSPWPDNTVLWPTLVLAGASGASLIFALGLLITICCRPHRERIFSVLTAIIHIIAWAVVAFLYRYFKSVDDLWGWSCGSTAKSIQYLYEGNLNFEIMCKLQGSSWFISLSETGLKVLFTALAFFYYLRQKNLKEELANYVGEEMVNQAADML